MLPLKFARPVHGSEGLSRTLSPSCCRHNEKRPARAIMVLLAPAEAIKAREGRMQLTPREFDSCSFTWWRTLHSSARPKVSS